VILGGRFVNNEYFGQKFVPRLGLTHIWEKFHVKALFSQAFRSPSVENINLNSEIKPESTTVLELEFGFKPTSNSYLTANAFDITTKNPIVYFYNEMSEDDYENEEPTGSRGFELEYKWKQKTWFFNANYSYYSTAGHPVIHEYAVPGHPNSFLAFPNHKFNATASFKVYRKWSLTSSLTYMSERYSLISTDPQFQILIRYKPSLYLNMNLSAEDILVKGLTIGLSCHNCTDAGVYYIQPYANNHATVPGNGREYRISLHYNLAFKKK
jgi:outer membrane receptor for ferrienterochelin and colicin